MTVTETVTYEFDLDLGDLEIPEEVMRNSEALEEWLEENEYEWVDELTNENFVGCEDREIDEYKVLTLKGNA